MYKTYVRFCAKQFFCVVRNGAKVLISLRSLGFTDCDFPISNIFPFTFHFCRLCHFINGRKHQSNLNGFRESYVLMMFLHNEFVKSTYWLLEMDATFFPRSERKQKKKIFGISVAYRVHNGWWIHTTFSKLIYFVIETDVKGHKPRRPNIRFGNCIIAKYNICGACTSQAKHRNSCTTHIHRDTLYIPKIVYYR